MPMVLRVHAETCGYRTGKPCECEPQEFTDLDAARAAHGGDTVRLQFVTATPPPVDVAKLLTVSYHRSQARRHLRPISD